MISVTVDGTLFGAPIQRVAKNGATFTTAKVITSSGDGLWCNVITFNEEVQAQLLDLVDGSSVVLLGSMIASVYDAKDGKYRANLSLLVRSVLAGRGAANESDCNCQISVENALTDAAQVIRKLLPSAKQIAHQEFDASGTETIQ